MGQLQFILPSRDCLPQAKLSIVYIASLEGVPWQSENQWTDEGFDVIREVDNPGVLYAPWCFEGRGMMMLSTVTLLERTFPYHLPLELARGTLSRLRTQLARWKNTGFTCSEESQDLQQQAMDFFIRALASQADPIDCGKHADECLQATIDAMELAVDEFSRQEITKQREDSPQLTSFFAAALEPSILENEELSQAFASAFNGAALPICWRQIQPTPESYNWSMTDNLVRWCEEKNLSICAGPLLRLDKTSLPDWVSFRCDDFETLQAHLLDFIQAVAQRYQGKFHIWNCSARTNLDDCLDLEEDIKIRLSAAVIDLLRQREPNTPLIFTLAQPWAEYLVNVTRQFPPLHHADAMLRGNLGLSGIGIEINLGYWPEGTLPYDLLEINRRLNRWKTLGAPLVIFLTVPSSQQSDPLCNNCSLPVDDNDLNLQFSELQQAKMKSLIPLLLSNQGVQGIVWNQMDDSLSHDFPHGGLLDAQGQLKPLFNSLKEIRREYL